MHKNVKELPKLVSGINSKHLPLTHTKKISKIVTIFAHYEGRKEEKKVLMQEKNYESSSEIHSLLEHCKWMHRYFLCLQFPNVYRLFNLIIIIIFS